MACDVSPVAMFNGDRPIVHWGNIMDVLQLTLHNLYQSFGTWVYRCTILLSMVIEVQ